MKKIFLLLGFSIYILGQISAQTPYQIVGNQSICNGDTSFLSVALFSELSNMDTIPIADGTGISAISTISVSGFPAGDTISDANDIASVCLDIEHSWMRDLEIKLTCPSNKTIFLHEFPGAFGSQVWLGIPNDNDNDNFVLGTPGEYCFSNTPDFNFTWLALINSQVINTLPEGAYKPVDPFSNLIGCPLNGDWTLSITDLWPIDNGAITQFSIEFADDIASQEGLTFAWSNGDSIASTFVTENGAVNVSVTNESGAVFYDTITIMERPVWAITIDTFLIEGTFLSFYGSSITAAGTYSHTLTSAMGCDSTITWVVESVYLDDPQDGITILPDPTAPKFNNPSLTDSVKDILIAPNPTRGRLFIRSEHPIQAVRIYDSLGHLATQKNDFSLNFDKNTCTVELPSGVGFYWVIVQTEQKTSRTKIMKID